MRCCCYYNLEKNGDIVPCTGNSSNIPVTFPQTVHITLRATDNPVRTVPCEPRYIKLCHHLHLTLPASIPTKKSTQGAQYVYTLAKHSKLEAKSLNTHVLYSV